jgi:TM2 domain-containing membrane protein YozV
MSESPSGKKSASPILVAIAGWVLPGGGYFLIGEVGRGLIIFIAILALFIAGILLAGIRVIDVPGYDRLGNQEKIDPQGARVESYTRNARYFRAYDELPWSLTGRGFFGEVVNKPWYVCQILNGPVCLIASKASLSAARQGVPSSHSRIYEIGTLYTAIAGLLNLLAVIDAAHRAATPEDDA